MKKDAKNNLRDDAEPTVRSGAVYLPMWLMGLLALLFYWGCYHVDENGGGFNEHVFAPYRSANELTKLKPGGEDTAAVLGRDTYAKICVACHQPNGMGLAGQFPPLASEWVQAAGPNRVIRIILNGLTGPITVNGTPFNGTMLPWRDGLSDQEIAAVASYVRTSFGNKASKVTPEQVKKIREESKDKGNDNYMVDELLKFPESD